MSGREYVTWLWVTLLNLDTSSYCFSLPVSSGIFCLFSDQDLLTARRVCYNELYSLVPRPCQVIQHMQESLGTRLAKLM